MKELIKHEKTTIKAAVFDFDGTISTLRCGWEEVMEPLMLECISGEKKASDELVREVRDYIDRSAGIQDDTTDEMARSKIPARRQTRGITRSSTTTA